MLGRIAGGGLCVVMAWIQKLFLLGREICGGCRRAGRRACAKDGKGRKGGTGIVITMMLATKTKTATT